MKHIILDTDLGCDCDDVYALALLSRSHLDNKCSLDGVASSAPFPASPGAIRSILDHYGLSDIAAGRLGVHADGYYSEGRDFYAQAVTDAFPPSSVSFTESAELLRSLLAHAAAPVTLCVIGTLTNMSALLGSRGDEISPLDGVSLVREKVERAYIMAGDFTHVGSVSVPTAEWNVKLDIPAAQKFFDEFPCHVTVIPFELGVNVITGGAYVSKFGGSSPVSAAYIAHGSTAGRSSWDPITAYAAVYDGSERFGKLFARRHGDISVNADGTLNFAPNEGSRFEYLTARAGNTEIAG
ncbi:MAG: nucleoside hydrolase, partial [Eubacteriales bacterium]